jgi:hypothetical protein
VLRQLTDVLIRHRIIPEEIAAGAAGSYTQEYGEVAEWFKAAVLKTVE